MTNTLRFKKVFLFSIQSMSSDFGRALRVMAGPAQRMEARHYRILRGGNMSEAHEQGRIVKQLHDNIDRGAGLDLQDKQMLHTLLDNPENKTNQGLIRGRLRAQNTSLHNLYAAQINDPSNPGFEPTLAAATLQAAQSGVQIHPVNFLLGGASLMEMQQIKYNKSSASALAKSFRSKKVLQKARHFNSKQLLWYDQAARMSGGKPMAISVGTPSTSGPSSMQVDPQQNADNVLGGQAAGRGRGRRGGPAGGGRGGFDGGGGPDGGGSYGRRRRAPGGASGASGLVGDYSDGPQFSVTRARVSRGGYQSPPTSHGRPSLGSTIPYNLSTVDSPEHETDSPRSLAIGINRSLGLPDPYLMATIGQRSRDSGHSRSAFQNNSDEVRNFDPERLRHLSERSRDSGDVAVRPYANSEAHALVQSDADKRARLRDLQNHLGDLLRMRGIASVPFDPSSHAPLSSSTPRADPHASLGQFNGVPQAHSYTANDDVTNRIAFLPPGDDEKEPADDPKVLLRNATEALPIIPNAQSKLLPNVRVPALEPHATQNTTLDDATSAASATPANNTLADSTSESPERPSIKFEDFASPVHNTEAGKRHLERFKKGLDEYHQDGKFNASYENYMRQQHRDILQSIATEIHAQRASEIRDRLTVGAPADGMVKEPTHQSNALSQAGAIQKSNDALSGDGASAAVKGISSTGATQSTPASGSKGLMAVSNVLGRGNSLDHATDGVAESANNIADSLAGSSQADDIIKRAASLHGSLRGSFSSGSSDVSTVHGDSPRTPRAPLHGSAISDISAFFNSSRHSTHNYDVNASMDALDSYFDEIEAHEAIDRHMVNEEFERSYGHVFLPDSDGAYSPTVSEVGKLEYNHYNDVRANSDGAYSPTFSEIAELEPKINRFYTKFLQGYYKKEIPYASKDYHKAFEDEFNNENGDLPVFHQNLVFLHESFERAQATVKQMTEVTPGDSLEKQTAAHPANDNQQDILQPFYQPNEADDTLLARIEFAGDSHEKNREDVQRLLSQLMATSHLIDGNPSDNHKVLDAHKNANRYLTKHPDEIVQQLKNEDAITNNADLVAHVDNPLSSKHFGAYFNASDKHNNIVQRKEKYARQEHLLSKNEEAASDFKQEHSDLFRNHERGIEPGTKEYLTHIAHSDNVNHLSLRAALYEQAVKKNRQVLHQNPQVFNDFGYTPDYEDITTHPRYSELHFPLRTKFPQVHRDLADYASKRREIAAAAQTAAESAQPATSVVAPTPPQHETLSILKEKVSLLKQEALKIHAALPRVNSPLKAGREEKLAAAKLQRDRARVDSDPMQQIGDAFIRKLQQSSPASQDSRTTTNATLSTPVGLVSSPAGGFEQLQDRLKDIRSAHGRLQQEADDHLAHLQKAGEDLRERAFKRRQRQGYMTFQHSPKK